MHTHAVVMKNGGSRSSIIAGSGADNVRVINLFYRVLRHSETQDDDVNLDVLRGKKEGGLCCYMMSVNRNV